MTSHETLPVAGTEPPISLKQIELWYVITKLQMVIVETSEGFEEFIEAQLVVNDTKAVCTIVFDRDNAQLLRIGGSVRVHVEH